MVEVKFILDSGPATEKVHQDRETSNKIIAGMDEKMQEKANHIGNWV